MSSFVKVFFAVLLCKILYFTGKLVGKGSSLPGKIVLKIFPDILAGLKLPEIIIAVTGSNGKTTTTELITYILKAGGMKAAYNHEGSNQTEGIATLLLRVASFCGRVKPDAIVMECDERYLKKIFEKVRPSALLVTNLCRDQLTRNGHHEFVKDCISEAIEAAGHDMRLILNADDPYVASLAADSQTYAKDVLWFGIEGEHKNPESRDKIIDNDKPEAQGKPDFGMYDDGAFCTVCKERMEYTYRTAGHFGDFGCTLCNLKRKNPDIEAQIKNDGTLLFSEGAKLRMPLPSITAAYNLCAAAAASKTANIAISDAVKILDGYELKSGRTAVFSLGSRKGLLLISKHENSFAYNAWLKWISRKDKPCTVIILVDSISRKYYTCETSWLWDIDFNLLACQNVVNVVLAGQYVYDLATRFAMTDIAPEKMGYVTDLKDLREYVQKNTMGDIYTLTCFADKAKLKKVFRQTF